MVKASQDIKLTVLADHYKDTQRILEHTVRNRDRNFFLILVFLVIMAFQFFSPEQSNSVLTQATEKWLNVDGAGISISYISTIIWFGLFAVAIRYFQTVINLEKQYNYIHAIEAELSNYYSGKAFTREGKSYLKDYPKFSVWLHVVYRIVFPLLLLGAVTIKIVSEWRLNQASDIPLLLNSAIFGMLVASTVLYAISLQKLEKNSEADI